MFISPCLLLLTGKMSAPVRRAATFLTLTCLSSMLVHAAGSYNRVVGYWEDLSGATTPVNPILLTHLNYAFASITAKSTSKTTNGVTTTTYSAPFTCELTDTSLQTHFTTFKTTNPNLKILISVGGAGGSLLFSPSNVAAWNANPANQNNQVALTNNVGASADPSFPGNCVAAIVTPFLNSGSKHTNLVDGIDVDWEFPTTSTDTSNLTTMMATFQKQLQSTSLGQNALLTLTLGTLNNDEISNGNNVTSIYNFKNADSSGNDLNKVVSFYNVMTYDYASGAAATPNAPLYDSFVDNTDTSQDTWNGTVNGTIAGLIGLGAPANELVLGIPFYAYQYTGVAAGANGTKSYEGFYQAPSGVITQPTFGAIANTLANYTRYCDVGQAGAANACPATWTSPFTIAPGAGAQEAWTYDPSLGNGTFTIFDDAGSIAAKVKYQREMGLGGIMIWEITGDTSAARNPSFGDNYLLKTIVTDMQAQRFAVGASAPAGLAAADIWEIDSTNSVDQYNGLGWTVEGSMAQISVGSDGDTWGLTNTGQVYHYAGAGSWTGEPGTMAQVSVGDAVNVVGLTAQGTPYKWNSSTKSWTLLNGQLAQIAAAANGDVWGLTSMGVIYQYSSGSWIHKPGSLAQIAVASPIPTQSNPRPATYVVGFNVQGAPSEWNNSTATWTSLGGQVAQISVGSDGAICGTGTNGVVYNFVGGVWNRMNGGILSSILVGSDANIWGLTLQGGIYQYVSGAWRLIPGNF